MRSDMVPALHLAGTGEVSRRRAVSFVGYGAKKTMRSKG